MTRHRTTEPPLVVYGVNAVRELLRSATPVDRLWLAPGPAEEELRAAARARGLPIARADRDALTQEARSPHHQGVVARTPPFAYADIQVLLEGGCRSALLLDGVQDPRNLGAILRTARAVGVGGVVLPRDRSVGITPVVVAASAGLLFGVPICRETNLVRSMEALKAAGYWLVGLAAEASADLFRFDAPDRPAIVVGGEGAGLRPLVRRHCDFTVSIPMAPGVESLNVSVAAGVALYRLVPPRANFR